MPLEGFDDVEAFMEPTDCSLSLLYCFSLLDHHDWPVSQLLASQIEAMDFRQTFRNLGVDFQVVIIFAVAPFASISDL